MNKELLWDLFKKTGKIEYYIKYKKEGEIDQPKAIKPEKICG